MSIYDWETKSIILSLEYMIQYFYFNLCHKCYQCKTKLLKNKEISSELMIKRCLINCFDKYRENKSQISSYEIESLYLHHE
jgi:hypothetical protein